MKEYKYKINGNSYKVTIGDIEDNIAHVEVNGTHYKVEMEKQPKPAAKPVTVRPMPNAPTAPTQVVKPTAPSTGKSGVKSPLPGVILDIKVNVGDTVKKGQTIIILEAMNSFMMERIQPVYKILPYELYFYGGALMNVFVMWEKNGKQETPEAIAKTLASGAVFTADMFPASCDGNR